MRITRGGLLKSSDAAGAFAPLPAAGKNPLTGMYHVDGYGFAAAATAAVNRAAAQAALDAADTAGGGRVRFPSGTFDINAGLLYGSKTIVEGNGPGGTVIRQTNATTNALTNKGWNDGVGNTDVTIRDLTVDGLGAAQMGVVLAGVQGGTVHNVRVKDFTHYGVWLWASGENSIDNQGLPTRGVAVTSVHVTGGVDVGIEADASCGNTVSNCTVEMTAGICYYIWNGATDNTFTGNIARGVGASPVVTAYQVAGITAGATGFRQTARNTFSGNDAYNVKVGVKFQGLSGNIIEGATWKGGSIQGIGGVTSTAIVMNYVTRCSVKGLYAEGFYKPFQVNVAALGGGTTTDSDIDDNTFYTFGSGGDAYQMKGGSISDNTFVGVLNHVLNLWGCVGTKADDNRGADCGDATSGAVSLVLLRDDTTSGTVVCDGVGARGNKIVDRRATKYLTNCVRVLGGSDYSILTGNSARGGATGGLGVQASGNTGTHNVTANNMDA